MTKSEYAQRAFDALNKNRITEDEYDAMMMNADIFCYMRYMER